MGRCEWEGDMCVCGWEWERYMCGGVSGRGICEWGGEICGGVSERGMGCVSGKGICVVGCVSGRGMCVRCEWEGYVWWGV